MCASKGQLSNINICPSSSVGKNARLISSNTISTKIEMDTNIKGTITELKCKTYFLELGYMVSTPEAPTRYDFILDTGNKLLKIQVKTSHLEEDGAKFAFKVSSTHITANGNSKHHYRDDGIDYFCTWYDNECYLVPVSECGTDEKFLRLKPTKNGQVKNISFAKDYVAKEVLSR